MIGWIRMIVDLDDGKIPRKPPSLPVKTYGFPVQIFPWTNPLQWKKQIEGIIESGLRENLNRKPIAFPIKIMVLSCKFSLKPIQEGKYMTLPYWKICLPTKPIQYDTIWSFREGSVCFAIYSNWTISSPVPNPPSINERVGMDICR